MAKILVVDDDVDFVESTRLLLMSKGYDVLSARDGETGYRLAKTEAPDLLLLDLMMTYDTEGLDTARKLREDPATRGIPVVCVTGIRAERDLPGRLKPDEKWLPVRAVLEKPVKPDKLLQAVREAL